ncbi:MAG: MoaD/ThiS family protein [Pseudanabaenaceae cyanobacterium bins.39]|nr:MoaD/ThiS family protein [Pseudanabaenaceae cyanobacterium bins.39]
MEIKVKLFAIFQETFNQDELKIDLAANTPVSHVFDHLVAMKPELEKWRSHTRYAINLQFVPPQTIVFSDRENDDNNSEVITTANQKSEILEIALIPPVSGG